MLETFTAQTFSSNVGDTFQLLLDGVDPIEMHLIAVEDTSLPTSTKQRADQGLRQPFALLFRNPQGYYLPQRIYHLEHEQLGAFDLFLVPIGPDSQGMRYEAVFG